MSYPLVNVYNSTSFTVKGKVNYASAFCSDDSYTVTPFNTWKASSRGTCLVTKITATVYLSDGSTTKATAYTSSGTSYSQFAVIKQGSGYAVTRVVSFATESGSVDVIEPKILAEPTKKQK